MKNILQFLFTIVILFSINAYSQTSDKDITEAFFKTFKESPATAMTNAFNTNPWMKRNADAVDNLINQFNNLLPLIGEYHGYELIAEGSIGKSLKMSSYLVKFDRQPLRFTFIFYKVKDSWQMQNLKYDDKLDDELEQVAREHKSKF